MLSALAIFFIILQAFTYYYIKKESLASIDAQLENSAKSTHNLIELTIKESIRNYLRGRVEDSIYSLQAIDAAIKRGAISEERGLQSARIGISGRKIGESGYFYVIDSKGTVILHPEQEIIGSNISELDFIQEQMKKKSGYLQYVWFDTNNNINRKKALFMEYFEPWDWIIAASIYRDEFKDLIDIGPLKSEFLNPIDLGSKYKYIVDGNGNILIHPYYQDNNIFDLTEDPDVLKIFEEKNSEETISGITEYYWQNPDEEKPEKYRVYYSWIPELDWGIISTFKLEEQQETANIILMIMVVSNLILLGLTTLLLFVLTRQIIGPLSAISLKLLNEEELSNAGDIFQGTRDEIKITELALDKYVRRLNEEKERAEEALERNKILARFPNNVKFPIIRINRSGKIFFTNNAARTELLPLLGIDPEAASSPILRQFYGELEGHDRMEKFIMGKIFHIFRTPVPGKDEIYLHIYDLTTEQRFLTLQKIWGNVFKSSIEGITITDIDGNIERVNNSFTRITGYSAEEAVGQNTRVLKSNRHNQEFYDGMWESLKATGSWEGEIWNRRKSGDIYPEWLSITTYFDSIDQKQKCMAIFHDISDLHQKEEELAFVSSHDILTNLPNRSLFYDRVKQALLSAARTKRYCAVIIIDINGFSMINDHLGQIWGDKYLVYIAELFRETIRSEDTLARLGSDDFAILLPRLDKKDQCMDVLQRIRDFLKKPVRLNDEMVKPVVNIGIGIYPDDAESAEDLIKKANLAMIESKSQKPGSHRFYDKSLDENLKTRFEMELALKQSLEKDDFRLVYQPKADLNTGEITGFEALLRWEHPKTGSVSPEKFIPILEETGLIIQVGEWIIREVCRFINRIKQKTGKEFQVGINISTTQFNDPDFVEKLEKIMAEEGIGPKSIDLEITESITAMKTKQTIQVLNHLHEKNFSISIDDFGTGYSSLQYLSELPFDVIKIDRSFVAPLPDDSGRLSIVRSIIDLGKNYGKKTIAEGIETKEQNNLLKEEGCDIIQGYYLSRPLTEKDAMEFIISRKQG